MIKRTSFFKYEIVEIKRVFRGFLLNIFVNPRVEEMFKIKKKKTGHCIEIVVKDLSE